MNVIDIQNYLDENLPEAKFQVSKGKFGPADFNIEFITSFNLKFISHFCRDKELHNFDKVELLIELKNMMYQNIGILTKLIDDIRKCQEKLK